MSLKGLSMSYTQENHQPCSQTDPEMPPAWEDGAINIRFCHSGHVANAYKRAGLSNMLSQHQYSNVSLCSSHKDTRIQPSNTKQTHNMLCVLLLGPKGKSCQFHQLFHMTSSSFNSIYFQACRSDIHLNFDANSVMHITLSRIKCVYLRSVLLDSRLFSPFLCLTQRRVAEGKANFLCWARGGSQNSDDNCCVPILCMMISTMWRYL